MILATILHLCSALAAAYCLSVPGGGASGRTSFRVAAGLCAAAAFLFLPLGCLPPLITICFTDVFWGAPAFFLLIAAGLLLTGEWRTLLNLVLLVIIFGVYALFFHLRGVPGSSLNFGTFTAMPFWSMVSISLFSGPFFPGLEGVACLLLAGAGFCALLGMFAMRPPTTLEGALLRLAVCALWVALFFPLNVTPYVFWPNSVAAAVDAIFFWGKAIAVYWLAQRVAFSLARQPVVAKGAAKGVAICTGVLLCAGTLLIWCVHI
ncbi:MAG: hypothetical protein DELT_00435 [Desulfovibrio sp.]